MAFPQHTVTGNGITTNTTNHTVTMPATVDAGDLLIIFGAVDGVPTVTAWGDGFVERKRDSNASGVTLFVATKTADGDEDGTSVAVTLSASERAAWQCLRVTGWHGTDLPEYGTAVTGSSTQTHDPPSLAPSWGAEDTLFIALLATDADRTIDTWPTSYTLDQTTQNSSSGTGGGAAHSAGRELNSTSDDPAAFDSSANCVFVVQTMAIRPAGGGGGATVVRSRLPVLGVG